MKKYLFLLTLLVLGMGCSTSTPDSALKTNFFPHEDGYSWEYKYTETFGTIESIFTTRKYFDKSVTLNNDVIVQKFIVSYEALSQIAKTKIIVSARVSSLNSDVNYYYIDEKGVYTYGYEGYPTTEATLFLPLPLQVGKKWSLGHYYSCEAIAEEKIIVSAGTFNAIKVALNESNTTESSWYIWYADGVGMVKSYQNLVLYYFENGSFVQSPGVFVEELVSKNF